MKRPTPYGIGLLGRFLSQQGELLHCLRRLGILAAVGAGTLLYAIMAVENLPKPPLVSDILLIAASWVGWFAFQFRPDLWWWIATRTASYPQDLRQRCQEGLELAARQGQMAVYAHAPRFPPFPLTAEFHLPDVYMWKSRTQFPFILPKMDDVDGDPSPPLHIVYYAIHAFPWRQHLGLGRTRDSWRVAMLAITEGRGITLTHTAPPLSAHQRLDLIRAAASGKG